MKIAILGAGNMGTALAKGLLRGGIAAKDVVLTCRSPQKHAELTELQFTLLTDNRAAIASAEVVILAVKPWQIVTLLQEITPDLSQGATVISVAAGITVAELSAQLPKDVHAVRAMPNTAVALNEGVIALASSSEKGRTTASALLSPLGLVVPVEESKMDALTALAGCGIAHALRFLRAAQCAGVQMGLPADQSAQIFAQVMAGAVALMRQPNTTAEQEIDRICTPGGLTIRGLNALEQAGFTTATIQGLLASLPKEQK